ncbi:MAG: MBOAT family protein [Clostridium sp.]|nr:MBOAT family protein [Acetatifactor muris]MCM1526052.1 MBOAT family protein [Bacteroides sp.]MCM1562188.1 MBOAT family protein [Clostridium sp.]
MLFNSYIFILFFLPLALALYFGLNGLGRETGAKWALIGMSLWFYAYFHISYLPLILGSLLFNFPLSRLIGGRSGQRSGKILLATGIAANLGIIFYYKYFNFFLESSNAWFGTDFAMRKILMPLGISFFTFQQISWLVDSYRMETADCRPVDYALYITFFPQLVAGPIVLHDEMIPQFGDKSLKRLDQDRLAAGIRLFAIGLFKKVLIADTLGRGADWGFANPQVLTAPDVAVVSILYTLQLYFDFSGYCDMACGIAGMFGFELPLNFNSPYKAVSIQDFWKRWHMTLTRFLRKYLYFPLGGSRKGTVRTWINILIVFTVSGIWHGAGWTFILWGLIHGIASVLYRIFKCVWDRLPRSVGWLATFVFVDLTWILFRADSLESAAVLYGKLLAPWDWSLNGALLSQFDLLEFTYVEEHVAALGALAARLPFMHMALILAVALSVALIPRNCHEKKFVPGAVNAVGSIVMLVWSIMSLSGLTTFLYFNF